MLTLHTYKIFGHITLTNVHSMWQNRSIRTSIEIQSSAIESELRTHDVMVDETFINRHDNCTKPIFAVPYVDVSIDWCTCSSSFSLSLSFSPAHVTQCHTHTTLYLFVCCSCATIKIDFISTFELQILLRNNCCVYLRFFFPFYDCIIRILFIIYYINFICTMWLDLCMAQFSITH